MINIYSQDIYAKKGNKMTTSEFMNDLEKMKFIFNGVDRWKESSLYLYLYSKQDTSDVNYLLFNGAVDRSMNTVSNNPEELEEHYMTTYTMYGRDCYLSRDAVYAVILEVNPSNQTIIDAKNAIINKAFN